MSAVLALTEQDDSNDVSTLSDTQVMERLRDGDDDALAIIVERYQNELVGYFYHHCWDQLNAEDLAQTVFIKLFRARARYQATAKLRTYLYRIAHNAWVDFVRRQRNHLSLDAEVGHNGLRLVDTMAQDFDPEENSREALVRRRIQEAVELLPEGQRDVFVLANNQGLKYQEIGGILDIPEGTVKSRMHAAVRNLRKHLADLVDES
ncbi:MAG: sigma-70 family RNA polymerase sigma factor [Planctomycetota bacterium]|nr:sigma-70 family RNA polymerase sigma factor [Planctomycetota bacterium]